MRLGRIGKQNLVLISGLLLLLLVSNVSAELIYINDVYVDPGNEKNVSILISGIGPAGLNSGIIELHYDPSIVIVTAVPDSDFYVLEPNIQNSSGYTRIVVAQSGSSLFGPGPIIFANVTLKAVGVGGEISSLNLIVTELLRYGDVEVFPTVNDGTFIINGENCPDDPLKIEPGVCGCGVPDTDTDGDGVADCNDNCDNDPNKVDEGICGCGLAETDTDSDGFCADDDNCPTDPLKTEPGTCGCGIADTDSDADGIADCNDLCPDDADKTVAGICGCGVADSDIDGDGTPDCNDACPNDPDNDAEGDGFCSDVDNCPTISNPDQTDADGNGIGDACETSDVCTFSQGYWKNHEADWVLLETEYNGNASPDWWFLIQDDPFNASLPSQTGYNWSMTWMDVFNTPGGTTPVYTLAQQYMGAYLNYLNGASMPAEVQSNMTRAYELLTNATFNSGTFDFNANPIVKTEFEEIKTVLDNYNKGSIGPGHCSEENSNILSSSGGKDKGGRGGGGGGSGENRNNILTSMFIKVYLVESEPALYLFEGVPVDSIQLIPKGTYGMITGLVEVLHGPSSQIEDSKLPDGKINQFLNIYLGYDRWAEGRLSDIIINFRVPYQWFADNNIDPAKLTMYRFNDGEWHPLETTLNGQNGEYYLYSTSTSGFSSFAIVGQTEEETKVIQGVSDIGISEIADSPDPQTAENQKSPGFGFVLATIGIGFALSRRKK
ncbi:MAG TPA: PGF-pre-PGF domain-containing protein [archaeon]|nr:PGF-pre-PGF domain-containing protein [archaeon]